MLPTIELLRGRIGGVIATMRIQGHVVDGLKEELEGLPDSYDELAAFARKVADAPLRDDWPYVEPNDLEAIWAECDPNRELEAIADLDLDDASKRIEAAFEGAVAGCILGKPLEVNPTLAEIRTAAEAVSEWPINDYITVDLLEKIGRRHGSWETTTRDNITAVVPDDDLNYTTLGMLVLEKHGINFTKEDLMTLWLENLAPRWTFGPERTLLIKAAMHSIGGGPEDPFEEWAGVLNPGAELCGAQIRADAYGYACPGRPALAAEFAWRDSSWTHRRTGIYGTMFVSAAIACAAVMDDRLAPFETALKYVPQRSRFYEITADCLDMVREASDWMDGYERINKKYGEWQHCKIYQETGTLINSMRFAESVGHGMCVQVMQGNDTDCYGEIIGSLLGAFFGPGHLEERWLEPFGGQYHTGLAAFHEQSLEAVTKRMGALPALVAGQLAER